MIAVSFPPRAVRAASLILAVLLLGGCANYMRPFETTPPRPGHTRATQNDFRNLPEPKSKVVAGVYRFRDQTGQYENTSRGGISYSTAVTQGGTAILVSALERSGWFNVVERRGLSNLVNERKIVNQMRSQYQGQDGRTLQQLPPLMYAGVLLEGGIIGYDSNVITGGMGARYFGLGASGKFRRDQITVHLRAVSTQNGEVLESVRATKTIMSQQVDANLFRFVEPSRLLEAETGYSFNEPRVIAVTEAIDEAVKALIIEGVRGSLWSLKNPEADTTAAFRNYDRRKALAARRNAYGQMQDEWNRPNVGFGVSGGGQRIEGNVAGAEIRPSFRLRGEGSLKSGLGLGLEISGSHLSVPSALDQYYFGANLHGIYYALPQSGVTPYLRAGGGVLGLDVTPTAPGDMVDQGVTVAEWTPYVLGTVGMEWMVTSRFGFRVGLTNEYPLKSDLDGTSGGRWHDSIWHVEGGVTVYPFW